MPALKKTNVVGRIVWLGLVTDRKAALPSVPVTEVQALFSGPVGEAHGGLIRPSCSRVSQQYPRGTPIRNTRQFSVLSAEDLIEISGLMGISGLDPTLIGATMVLEGIADFSHLPPSSRLQGEGGATLVVDVQNRPCVLPGPWIEAVYPGKGAAFKTAAARRRGVTAWVEREGTFRVGEAVTLHIPDQRAWAG